MGKVTVKTYVLAMISKPTSLRDATALWRGVNHMLSLALTRAPKNKEIHKVIKQQQS